MSRHEEADSDSHGRKPSHRLRRPARRAHLASGTPTPKPPRPSALATMRVWRSLDAYESDKTRSRNTSGPEAAGLSVSFEQYAADRK